MRDLYWLTGEQMDRLRPFFPKSHGKPRVDDRRVLSGIIFVNRKGLRWLMHPGNTVHTRRSTTAGSARVPWEYSSA
ncbi:transposase [Acetobacter nitrogenifigens]